MKSAVGFKNVFKTHRTLNTYPRQHSNKSRSKGYSSDPNQID
ncbi:hypothetical protein HMPREF9996_00595 [Aggregatibacter actinomycetemcomitans Y4]|nr:hypothetical protein HMPREF9996_00595 [Aggregatibacter actinomycetemcomitans Y4]